MIDFEKGILDAIELVYLNFIVNCNFNFCKTIMEKSKKVIIIKRIMRKNTSINIIFLHIS